EYACCGGPMANRAAGAAALDFDQPPKRLRRPSKVGSDKPNRLGVHDLYGNVRELGADPGGGAGHDRCRGRPGGGRGGPLSPRNYMVSPWARYSDVGLRVARVPVRPADPRREDFDAWRKEVAALPADQQVAAVTALLRVRNPTFYDVVTPRIAGGVVTELRL